MVLSNHKWMLVLGLVVLETNFQWMYIAYIEIRNLMCNCLTASDKVLLSLVFWHLMAFYVRLWLDVALYNKMALSYNNL